MENSDLGNRMKSYEGTYQFCLTPRMPIITIFHHNENNYMSGNNFSFNYEYNESCFGVNFRRRTS